MQEIILHDDDKEQEERTAHMDEVTQTTQTNKQEPLITTEELAARLRVGRTWVYRHAHDGTVPTIKVGKYLRFDFQEVMKALTREGSK